MTQSKKGERNYPLEAYNNVINQVPNIKNVIFACGSYKDLIVPQPSIIYCDIPYKNSKEYKTAKDFCHDEFCDWARKKSKAGHTVFVSEYWMPEDLNVYGKKKFQVP